MTEQCQAKTNTGNPCAAKPRPGREWCAWHDPELMERRQEWSRRGGKGKATEARLKKAMPAALTSDDLLVTLSRIIKRVEDGELEPNILTAISGAARTMAEIRKASEVEELTRRLGELEALAAQRRLA